MSDVFRQKPKALPDRIVRSFWHGPFSPYEALCLSTFVAAGLEIELFCEPPVPELPKGVVCRNARDILNQDVAFYRHEFDGASPALHSNHFRYALLETLGGWWIDTDVMLLAERLPTTDIFIARQSEQELNGAVIRFPARHQLMSAARKRTEERLDQARWGETGPKLLTELLNTYAPDTAVAPREYAYAIGPNEFQKFFLPANCEEVEERTSNSMFVHLWNEMWRKAGIPKTIAPPKGCWLDRMFDRYQIPIIWSDRLEADYIQRWAKLREDRDHAGYHNEVHYRELLQLRAEINDLRRGPFFRLERVLATLKAHLKMHKNSREGTER